MRLLLRPQGVTENPYHPEYNDFDQLFGEIGQVIEWLIFGHLVEMSTRYVGILFVYCWGSHRSMGQFQIIINRFAATQMFTARPPIRMAADALRTFLANMTLEEQGVAGREQVLRPEEISGVPLTDLDMPDADSQYSGHRIGGVNMMYRRSIWRVRAEEDRANRGLPPLLGVPKVLFATPIDEPVRPPRVARLFLRTRYVVFTTILGFTLYRALSPNSPSLGYSEELVIRFMNLFELQPTYILFIILVAVVALLLGFPGQFL